MQSFADDTHLFFSSDNLQYLESVMNHELKLIYKYCALNKLSINFARTNYMLVMVIVSGNGFIYRTYPIRFVAVYNSFSRVRSDVSL